MLIISCGGHRASNKNFLEDIGVCSTISPILTILPQEVAYPIPDQVNIGCDTLD